MNGSLGGIGNQPIDPQLNVEHAAKKRKSVHVPHSKELASVDEAGSRISSTAVESVKRATSLKSVEKVRYDSLENRLKTGDVFLSYYPPGSRDAIATGISAAQYPKGDSESHNLVHVAMYVGDGKLSEAVSDGVRLNDLAGDRFRLEPGMKHGFLVIRPKNSNLAEEAARIAKELSASAPHVQTNHEYSILKALGASVSDGKLTLDGVKRYLKGAAYAYTGVKPTDANGIREFFCSHFIGWAFQAGESKDVIAKINAQLPPNKQIVFPEVEDWMSPKDYGQVLENWAADIAKKHFDLLDNAIKLRFDAKKTTPDAFYRFAKDNPELFTIEMMIVAPPERRNIPLVNDVALKTLHIEHLAQGKDKRVWQVSKDALLKMSPDVRAKWEGAVLIEPLTASRGQLVKEEFALMDEITRGLDIAPGMETNLALSYEKVTAADGKVYYIMPKAVADGERAITDPKRPYSFEQGVSYCKQFVHGMTNLHSTGRVHGDLKPENLLIYENDRLAVADFGKSKKVPTSSEYKGNTRFGPPEGKLSKAGDVYGAGLVMIRMLEEVAMRTDPALQGKSTLFELENKKNVPAHSSRRGVEKFIVENPRFSRSFETKDRGLLGGKGQDIAARVKTVKGIVDPALLEEEEIFLNLYIQKLTRSLLNGGMITEEQRARLEWLLMDMVQINETRRPTMSQVQERFEAIFTTLSDTESSLSPMSSFVSSELSPAEVPLRPLLIHAVKVEPFSKGKVNAVLKVTTSEVDPVSGDEVFSVRIFKPNQPTKTSFTERVWGSATLSGIPPDKEANLPARAVASSVVDKLLFPGSPISVDTRFAVVDGKKGILMSKAIGKSPEVVSHKETPISPAQYKKLLEDTEGVEDLQAFAGFLSGARDAAGDKSRVVRVERREGGLVAIEKKYTSFDPKSSNTVLGLEKLQVLDWICGQVDRHPGNYLIDKDGNVTGIDQDASFGVRAAPRGVDVRRQATYRGMPNMGSLMLNMPAVMTEATAASVLALSEESLRVSLKGLITQAEIEATIDRLAQLKEHINNPKACTLVADANAIRILAKNSETRPMSQRLITPDNSYWAREVYKLKSGETNWNYLRYPTK